MRSQTRRGLLAIALLLLCSSAALAQQGGITTGGGTERPIFVSGTVAMADGQPLKEKVKIMLHCPPREQAQGHTDRDGRFSVQLGLDRFRGAGDASQDAQSMNSGFGGQLSGGVNKQIDGMSILSLMGCFLRASLAGYTSESFDLSRVRVGDTTNAGTLLLRPVARQNALDSAVSATALAAPNSARKSLEKARTSLDKKQYAAAEKELNKALKAFPKYADAWQELGFALQFQKRTDEARKAWQEAIAADSGFAPAYLSLARLSATEKNWKDAIEKAEAVIKLSPSNCQQAHYYVAVAYYNLSDLDKAFAEAREAVRLDTAHSVPLAEQLLGFIHAQRGEYASAVEQYRNYLMHAPPEANLAGVKELLAEAEARIAAGEANSGRRK